MSNELPLSTTGRTTLHRLRERGQTDRAELYAVLDAGLICHLGVVVDGAPVVLPTGYGRGGDTLFLHGSSANRSLTSADGQDVCVTVTHLDGLVCARAVFHHSVNYRSAVVLGTARLLTDDEQRLAALEVITEQLVPGRWAETRGPTRKELAATAVLAVPLAESSVKIRTGPPADDEEDYALDLIGDSAEGVGYLLKERVGDVDAFRDAVARVASGGSALDPEVVGRMLGRRRHEGPLDDLSPRERDVLGHLAEGKSNQGIADSLVVTTAAVEKHITSIFQKLGLDASPTEHRRVMAALTYLRDSH